MAHRARRPRDHLERDRAQTCQRQRGGAPGLLRPFDQEVDRLLEASPRPVAFVVVEVRRAECLEGTGALECPVARDRAVSANRSAAAVPACSPLPWRPATSTDTRAAAAARLGRIGSSLRMDRVVRPFVVVRQQLGELAFALPRLQLDPLGHPSMCSCAITSREAVVRDIPREDGGTRTRVRRRSSSRSARGPDLDPRDAVAPRRARASPIRVEQRPHGAVPEGASDHRGRLQGALLERGEQIDPRGEHTLNGVGDLQPLDPGGLVHQALHDLLEEERVAARSLEDPGSEIARHRPALDQEVEELSRLRRGQRLEQQTRVVPPSAAPPRSSSRELGARRAQEQCRPLTAIGEILEEIQQRRIGPVDVLDDHDDRTRQGEGRKERPPCGVEFVRALTRVCAHERDLRILQADRVGEGRIRPRRIGGDLGREQLVPDLAHLLDR